MTSLGTETWTGSDGSAWSGSWTTGFSPTGGSTTIQTNRGRQITGSATGYAFGSRTSRRRSATQADTVHKVKMRFNGEIYPGVWVRADSEMRAGTGYALVLSPPTNTWSINGWNGFTQIFTPTDVAFSFTADTDYWVEFGIVGTALKGRVYLVGDPVPAWGSEITDTTLSSGYYGLGAFPGNLGTTRVEWDDWQADDVFPASTTPITGTDSTTLTESAAVLVVSLAAVDSSTLTEGGTGLAAALSRVDTTTLTEGTTGLAAATSTTDSSTLTEGTTGLLQALVGVDSTTLSELSASLAAFLAATDTAALTEQPAAGSAALVAADTASQTEGTTGLAALLAVVDSAALTEQPAAGSAVVTATDSQQLVSEQAVVFDPSLAPPDPVAAADSWSLTEGTTALQAGLQLVDSATLAESPAALQVAAPAVDSATQTEATAALVAAVPAVDTLALAEQPTQLVAALAVVDQMVLSEAVAVVAAAAAALDSAALAEASALATLLARVDSGLLTEVSFLLKVDGDLITRGIGSGSTPAGTSTLGATMSAGTTTIGATVYAGTTSIGSTT